MVSTTRLEGDGDSHLGDLQNRGINAVIPPPPGLINSESPKMGGACSFQSPSDSTVRILGICPVASPRSDRDPFQEAVSHPLGKLPSLPRLPTGKILILSPSHPQVFAVFLPENQVNPLLNQVQAFVQKKKSTPSWCQDISTLHLETWPSLSPRLNPALLLMPLLPSLSIHSHHQQSLNVKRLLPSKTFLFDRTD